MRAKWHFGILLVILTVFGISQDQVTVPNQQIVLEFTEAKVSAEDSARAIAVVKQQLKAIGVNNIQVTAQQEQGGRLEIAYYSNTNVAIIKQLLLEDTSLVFDYAKSSKLPSKETPSNYNLDVFEILNNTDTNSGMDGKVVLEVKQEFDRFSNPNITTYFGVINVSEQNKLVKTALKVYETIAIAIDNTSHNIPEVRAGPNC